MVLVNGQKYRLTHRTPSQKRDRESVAVYLDEDNKSYVLSARPAAGTQEMPKEWVLGIEPVDEITECYVNKVL